MYFTIYIMFDKYIVHFMSKSRFYWFFKIQNTNRTNKIPRTKLIAPSEINLNYTADRTGLFTVDMSI